MTIKLEDKFESLIAALEMGNRDNLHLYKGGELADSLSNKNILNKALHKAKRLLSITNKECILIEGENSQEFITNFFAVMLSQNIPVPVTTDLWINELRYQEIIKSITQTTNAKIILGQKKLKQTLKDINLLVISDCEIENIRVSEKPIYSPKANDIAFIQFSSGSTGNPKGVTLTHKNVLANIRQITKRIHSNEDSNTVVSWLPVHHDMGLIGGLLVPLINDYDIHLMNPYEFAVSPLKWLKLVSSTSANIIVAPNSGYHMATTRIKEKYLNELNLKSVRIALCGAEPINAKTLNQFINKFEICNFKASAFVPCYGMAENTLAISFHDNDQDNFFKSINISIYSLQKNLTAKLPRDLQDTQTVVSCGRPLEDVSVKIISDNGILLPENQIGEILIKSPSTTSGYYNREDLNKDLFIADHLRTGDIGFIRNGEVFITGRKKDLIIIGGININAEELESFATKIDGIKPGRLAAFAVSDTNSASERIHLIIEARKNVKFLRTENRELFRKQISDNLCKYFPIKEENISIVAPGTISKTTSGKVQRSKMKELYEAGIIDEQNYTFEYFNNRLKEYQIKSKLLKIGLISKVKKTTNQILGGTK